MRLRQVFLSLNEVPWTGLGVASAVAGTFLLLSYFVHIDYAPDIGSLISLSVAATGAALISLLLFLLAFQFHAITIRVFELPQLTSWETFSAQVFVFLALAVQLASIEGATQFWVWILLLTLLASTALWLLWLLEKYGSANRIRVLSTLAAAFGAFFVAFAFGTAVSAGAIPSKLPPWGIWLGLLSLVSFIGLLNAAGANAKNGWAMVAAMHFAVLIVVLVTVPPPGFMPTTLARLLGVKLGGTVELRVSRGSCLTIMSAIQFRSTDVAMSRLQSDAQETCREFGNRVTANVDFRWGSRWLLRVLAINGMTANPQSPRITIPDLGTELLLQSPNRRS